MRVAVSLHPHQHLFCLFDYSYPSKYEIVSHCAFCLHFLMTMMLSKFSCFLLTVVYLLWRNVYSSHLSILKLDYLSFYCWAIRLLCIFYKLGPWQTYDLYISSPILFSLSFEAQGLPCGWVGKDSGEDSSGEKSACNAGDLGLIPGLGRSPGEGKGYPLQYSGLQNSMDCIVHGVAKSQTRLSAFTWSTKVFDAVQLIFSLISCVFDAIS